MSYKISFNKQALKDYEKIKNNASLSKVVKKLLIVIEENPFTPPYEKLTGNLDKFYSRRINRQHRLVYTVNDMDKEIKVLSLWSHYESI